MRVFMILSISLLLAGCGSGGGGKGNAPAPGGGAGQGSTPPPANDCLAKNAALGAAEFPRAVDAVEAFARATITCGATLPALKRQAELMQQNGVTIGAAQ